MNTTFRRSRILITALITAVAIACLFSLSCLTARADDEQETNPDTNVTKTQEQQTTEPSAPAAPAAKTPAKSPAKSPTVPKNGIVEENGALYYYINNVKQTTIGFVTAGDSKYYISNSSGVLYANKFFDADLDGETGTFYAGSDGKIKAGGSFYAYLDGKRSMFYADANGFIQKNQLIKIGKYRYFFTENGSLSTGSGLHIMRFPGEKYFYLVQRNGIIKEPGYKVILKANRKEYLVNADGRIYPGIQRFGRHYYYSYYDDPCIRQSTGWYLYHCRWYIYVNRTGILQTHPFNYRGVRVVPSYLGVISAHYYNDAMAITGYGTQVRIDISDQKLTYYVNGRARLSTPVVTGNPHGHATPTGTFRLRGKARNVTLIGPHNSYRSFVRYWMPFKGNSYGMHDASWRGSFGGRIYQWNGSHGCVNMPPAKAAQLYSMIRVGTKVVITA